ncbi:Uu.00g054360.m01.CDS01 [Anthostomella pinea]|uniref:Uu.00g054360.m01.CDS01 n=1 Tax=Anthostomella pinea TaxID=933095 RepID=A0AAI8VWM1_9PEZI|nr:Uu.00g054360.m01.CDS01 [Anthostomella pinea]
MGDCCHAPQNGDVYQSIRHNVLADKWDSVEVFKDHNCLEELRIVLNGDEEAQRGCMDGHYPDGKDWPIYSAKVFREGQTPPKVGKGDKLKGWFTSTELSKGPTAGKREAAAVAEADHYVYQEGNVLRSIPMNSSLGRRFEALNSTSEQDDFMRTFGTLFSENETSAGAVGA